MRVVIRMEGSNIIDFQHIMLLILPRARLNVSLVEGQALLLAALKLLPLIERYLGL